jgi:hypothetical protein
MGKLMPYINIKLNVKQSDELREKIKEFKNLLGQFEGLTQEYQYIKSKIL